MQRNRGFRRIAAEHELAIRATRISEEEVLNKTDDYDTDLQLDDHDEVDVWAGEGEVAAAGMPEELWCDADAK